MGRLIPAGTGFAYHEKRAARKAGKVEIVHDSDEAAAAITEALNAETEMPQTDEE